MAMEDKKRKRLSPVPQTLGKFEPDGAPTEEKELAQVCARFADLCQYSWQQNIDLPSQIIEEVRVVSKLAVKERIARIKRLNQELVEYLNDVGPCPQIRQ